MHAWFQRSADAAGLANNRAEQKIEERKDKEQSG